MGLEGGFSDFFTNLTHFERAVLSDTMEAIDCWSISTLAILHLTMRSPSELELLSASSQIPS